MAVPARLELATFGLGNRCSIRLSYGTDFKSFKKTFWPGGGHRDAGARRSIASAGAAKPAACFGQRLGLGGAVTVHLLRCRAGQNIAHIGMDV